MNARLSRNDLIELEISDISVTGKSVGRHDGMVVMTDRGLPGELIECRITERKRSFALGRKTRSLRESPLRSEARCRHFEICGGCSWQDLSYADQLRFKGKFVSDSLERIGKLHDLAIEPPVPSIDQLYYRNKMEYSFSDEEGTPALGLHVRGRFDAIFDLEECFLQSPQSVDALKTVRQIASDLSIPFFNYRTGEGELRFLVVREGKRTSELMLNLVTFTRDFPLKDELFERVGAEVKGLTSLFHTVNGRKAHVAVGDELIHISGSELLTEKIGELTFQISPFSFFQTNSLQTEVLYRIIAEHAQPEPRQNLLDLFCGCGTISLYLATRVESILGIEINAEAIEMAKRNAALNRIDNAEFVAGDVRRLLVELHDTGRTFDTIVTDPPRAGMEQTAIRRIVRLAPKRIVAVSCNPATLARDLSLFADAGYRTTRVTPVDMFPHTAHIESVATLIRDESAATVSHGEEE